MTIIHANDPTTKFLSQLYEAREDVSAHIDESITNAHVRNVIRRDSIIMMLGHGNEHGLFSKPNKKGKYDRFLVTDNHVQFLRGKTCIGIWCHADQFAQNYGLQGLFSGMIISELHEAVDCHVEATEEEIKTEMEMFTMRLKSCLEEYDLKEIPLVMRSLDYHKSELNDFNYSHLHYFE